MIIYDKSKSKILFPDSCFSIGVKYKKINDKFNNLNENFKIFFNRNIDEIIRSKKYTNTPNMGIFKKKMPDTSDKLTKSFQKNLENSKRKFLSAKEIDQYRDNKRNLLKLMRNKKNNISLKKKSSFC